MDSKTLSIYKKIFKSNCNIIIFGLSYCGYSKAAINYLKQKKICYKYYEIDNIYDIFFEKIIGLSNLHPELNINLSHKTFPVIFVNKKFIGGYTELIDIV